MRLDSASMRCRPLLSASATRGRKSRAWTQDGFSAMTCEPASSAARMTGGETLASIEIRAIAGVSDASNSRGSA